MIKNKFNIIIFIKYSIIIITSLFIGLFSIEALLVNNSLINKNLIQYSSDKSKNFDNRNIQQVYNDLSKDYDNVVPVIFPYHVSKTSKTLVPLSSISNKKTIYCNETGEWLIYDSDRYGFNNNDSRWDKDELEFIIIGDSFAHGACVKREKNISSFLEKLSNKHALNLGFGGNGPLMSYSSLKEYFKKSKNIIYLYYEGNDLHNLKYELKNKILKSYFDDENFSQNLKKKQSEIDRLLIEFIDLEDKYRLTDYKSKKKSFKQKIDTILKFKRLKHIIKPRNFQYSEQKELIEFEILLKKFKKFSENNNANFYFVYLPEYYRFLDINRFSHLEKLEKLSKKNGIEFIDINALLFENKNNPKKFFPFEKFGHYNEEGYFEIANIIYNISSKK